MRNSNLIFFAVVAISAIGIGAASAADLPARTYTKAPAMVDPGYNWSGFYVGGNVGYADGRSNASSIFDCPTGGCGLTFPANLAAVAAQGTNSLNRGSFIGGGQFGYNWQVSRFVLGLEGDIQGLNYSKSIFSSSALPAAAAISNVSIGVQEDWLATARARVGFLAAPQLLIYGTGGAAFTTFKVSNQFFETNAPFPEIGASSTSSSRAGWTAGGGLEWLINNQWSIKGEYLHADFGSLTTTLFAGSTVANPNRMVTTANLKLDIGRIGLNYHLNAPTASTY
jgi:outer membrane immunogenic protein